MKVIIDRRAQSLDLKHKTKLRLDEIDRDTKELITVAKKQEIVDNARKYYAAARIQGLIRGFLSRLRTQIKRLEYRAALKIQRIIRGRQGKQRWLSEFWRNEAVVKTKTALELVIERSKVIREQDKKVGYWKEMYDPLTNRFWYYQWRTGQNTYRCPLVFQKELVCKWDGFSNFGGNNDRCRCVFSNMNDYEVHMLTKHKWFCAACDHKNNGLSFPECVLCGNTFSGNGDDGYQIIEENIKTITEKLESFLATEDKKSNANYTIKNRLLELAELETTSNFSQTNESHEHYVDPTKELVRSIQALKEGPSSKLTNKSIPEFKKSNTKSVFSKRNARIDGAAPQRIDTASEILEGIPEMSFASTVHLLLSQKLRSAPEVVSDADIEAVETFKRGYIEPVVFDSVVERKSIFQNEEDDEDSDLDENTMGTHTTTSWTTLRDGEKIEVCSKYLRDQCSMLSCPLAHPGIRDNAEIFYCRVIGAVRKVPFVAVCIPALSGTCKWTRKKDCKCYHVYIRPSTEHIVDKLYPVQGDMKSTFYPSGAILKGKVNKKHVYSGFGVMSWPDGSTYLGFWENNERNGFGLYRNAEGFEYLGMWLNGIKNGFGVLKHPNGDEYIGEWKNGVMEGVGILSCRTGDMYRGQFANHAYNGLGIFSKTSGEVYMGYFKNGKAHGLGVQGCLGNEKYKGYFDNNVRHGRGVCLFPNGCKYAGEWYRNIPNGFGVYVQPNRERYVGSWASAKMHGAGRYFFVNGDYYDGEFKQDIALGYGVYFHKLSGGLYKGQWSNNMRNGRGTYVFGNGSRYTGNWVDNIISGKGKFDYSCGSYYRGEFSNFRKHGKGIFTWPNRNVYKGMFDMCIMRGFGEMIYISGHRYVGNWDNNKKNGYGVMYYKNGDVYEGMWVDDLRFGKGKLTYVAGTCLQESYEGDWDTDVKHGYGKYIYSKTEGSIYEGQWKRGVRHGQGKLTFIDGSFYRGTFSEEKMDGYGVHVSAKDEDGNSTQYEGQWKNNMRHGTGTLLDRDGSIYQGRFLENRKHGMGNIQYANGTSYSGLWEYNQIRGSGSVTLPFKETPYGGPSQVRVKVFGF